MKVRAPHERIILAFDKSTFDNSDIALFDRLRGKIGGVKLGLETLSAIHDGNPIPVYYRLLSVLRYRSFSVMADWKLKDIPNTVAKATANIAQHGVWGVTMHSDAGLDVIHAAVAHRGTMHIIGVTVLTSMKEVACKSMYGRIPTSQVSYLAELLSSGENPAQAIVCSPLELDVVRREVGQKLMCITPGIRAKDAPPDDQSRTMTAHDAVKAGADYLVIGRPILNAPNPVAAAESFAEQIAAAEANFAMV